MRLRIVLGLLALSLAPIPARAADPAQALLLAKCQGCHNDQSHMSGLSMMTSAKLRQGGKRGPAVVPGHPDESVLYRLISGAQPAMPFQGQPLAAAEIAAVRAWIEKGAVWEDPQQWWSLRPIRAVSALSSIDAFILTKLSEKGLTPTPEAGRRALIRRLTYDLHGLPPTPEEVEAFVADARPGAYEALVDRLLASPRYGERWGRHWLDVVHYGESHGYDKDKPRRNAWPYRDYVIAAFNADKPYRRFVEEQLAGDVLYPADPDATVALGFIAAGPWDFVGHAELREGTTDKNLTRLLDRDDMVASTMSTFVSMTAHCARCHDHKFDPIPQKDYYGLQAVFAGIDRADRPFDRDPALFARRNALLQNKRELASVLRPMQDQAAGVSSAEIQQLDKQVEKWREISIDNPSLRPPEVKRQIAEAGERRKTLVRTLLPPGVVAEMDRLSAAIAHVDASLQALPKPELVYAASNFFDPQGTFRFAPTPRPTTVLLRGNVDTPGAPANPGALSCVSGLAGSFAIAPTDPEGARRAALAQWIVNPENPLTWRSIVNRVWHYHFGAGIVDSPNDFGHMGYLPTHPELLDWLAADFRDHGGSFKRLHKQIVMSAVYRQASTDNAANARIDGENRFLWRANRQRLDAESLRDSILAVSGKLDLTMGGPSAEQFNFKDDHSPVYDYAHFDPDKPANFRRSVYRFLVRSAPDPLMDRFDCPDISMIAAKRNTTITAIQALALLNNPFFLKQAAHFATRVQAMAGDPKGQIQAAYRLALQRPPSAHEQEELLGYLSRYGLAATCRVILNTNEFLFLD
jgi:mono/diheme cytochrome c family protein